MVGLKNPNGFGLYDMAGNVSEYVWMGKFLDGRLQVLDAGGNFCVGKWALEIECDHDWPVDAEMAMTQSVSAYAGMHRQAVVMKLFISRLAGLFRK